MSAPQPQPSPLLLFDTINAHQRTSAIDAAIKLDLFTAIGEGNHTAGEIARRLQVSERGARILCDYLTTVGFLTKNNDRYELTLDSATFLDRRSPAYMGTVSEFLLSPMLTESFDDVAAAVRKGGTILPDDGTVGPDNPVWVKFARAMAPMMALPSQEIARLLGPSDVDMKVLDIAAGHGLFGIAIAQHFKNSEITALDWPNVLQVAKENAEAAGVGDRYKTLPGSAFDLEFGGPYEIVLLTNFLHHFDPPTCEKLLRKVRGSLSDGGRAVTLEFVPNDDRVSPPVPAAFALIMLCSTPSGDAYTFKELQQMFASAGFRRSEDHELPPGIQHVVISHK